MKNHGSILRLNLMRNSCLKNRMNCRLILKKNSLKVYSCCLILMNSLMELSFGQNAPVRNNYPNAKGVNCCYFVVACSFRSNAKGLDDCMSVVNLNGYQGAFADCCL
jgi:hypothetical protein